ncbi:MAG: NAD(+)/NADH kinase [Sarcina sp.]
MNKIGILINRTKDPNGDIKKLIIEKTELYLEPKELFIMEHLEVKDSNILKHLDLLMVLGGDGTLLGAARKYSSVIKCPMLGINIGNLGFITSVEINEVDMALASIRDGIFKVEDRIMVKALINGEEFNGNTAVNDIVIARGTLSRMTEYNVFVDNDIYTSFSGDGIIVSTAVGSTAYSLSAGGPLIYPGLDLLSIVPICSHNLNSRPLIVNGNSEVKIYPAIEEDIYLTIDGQKSIKLKSNDEITVKKSQAIFKIISFENKKYFEVLRKKIFCRMDKTKGL